MDRKKMTIRPVAYPDAEETGIVKISVTYIQEKDTNVRTEDDPYNTLTIETEDGFCDKNEYGHSYYFILKTDRWALNDDEDLNCLIDDFNKRCSDFRKHKEKKGDE